MPGIKCSLHGAIDDARGNITGLYFCENECLNGYYEVKRQTILDYGIPISIYVDRHTIFKAPSNARLTIYDELEGKAFGLIPSLVGPCRSFPWELFMPTLPRPKVVSKGSGEPCRID